jgi:hypothetical protein
MKKKKPKKNQRLTKTENTKTRRNREVWGARLSDVISRMYRASKEPGDDIGQADSQRQEEDGLHDERLDPQGQA